MSELPKLVPEAEFVVGDIYREMVQVQRQGEAYAARDKAGELLSDKELHDWVQLCERAKQLTAEMSLRTAVAVAASRQSQ